MKLDAIFDAWDKDTGDGRAPHDDIRSMSTKYVKENPDEYQGWQALSEELLVGQIDAYREKGDEDGVRRVQVWLWHQFPPQNIGGVLGPVPTQ